MQIYDTYFVRKILKDIKQKAQIYQLIIFII